jgi:hypothetical protein
MDGLIRFFKVFFILAIFVAPALAPAVAIAGGIIVWGVVYLFLGVAAMQHNTAADLPWMFVDPATSFGMLIVFAAVLGLINGIQGSIAMIVAWAPAFLLPGYMLAIGLAVEHDGKWRGWVRDNYVDPGCELTSDSQCVYRPAVGQQLPIFIAERNNLDNVIAVIPYR